MTWGDAAQLLNALAAVVLAYAAFRNGRKIEAVRLNTNGINKQLNDLTAKSSMAEGVKQEKDRQEATRS